MFTLCLHLSAQSASRETNLLHQESLHFERTLASAAWTFFPEGNTLLIMLIAWKIEEKQKEWKKQKLNNCRMWVFSPLTYNFL